MPHHNIPSIANPFSDIDKISTEVNLTHSALRADERHGLGSVDISP